MKRQQSIFEATRTTVPSIRETLYEDRKEPSEEFASFLQQVEEGGSFSREKINNFQRLSILSDFLTLNIPSGTVKTSEDNGVPILEFTDKADKTVFAIRDENFKPSKIHVTGYIVWFDIKCSNTHFTIEFRLI